MTIQKTDFKIEINETYKAKKSKRLKSLFNPLINILFACIFIVVIPIAILFVLITITFINSKDFIKKHILKKNNDNKDEIDDDDFEPFNLYKSDLIEITAKELFAEDEFNDPRWHGWILMKIYSSKQIQLIENSYFDTNYFIFSNQLILNKIEINNSSCFTKLIQIELNTLEVKLIKEFKKHHYFKFNLIDEKTLKIEFDEELKATEILLKSN